MKQRIEFPMAIILAGIVLSMGPTVSAEERQEVAFEELAPYWEQEESRWRPSMAMAQNVISSLEPGNTAEIEVTFRIDGEGEVNNIQVVEATHDGVLEDMTRDRVSQMTFRRGEENPDGIPVIVRFEDTFDRH